MPHKINLPKFAATEHPNLTAYFILTYVFVTLTENCVSALQNNTISVSGVAYSEVIS
jgi:hypothetical protein